MSATAPGRRPTPASLYAAQLAAILNGALAAQGVAAFAELGVADHLAAAPRTARDLAGAVGADADSLERLLRALVAVAVVTEPSPGCFAATGLSDVLRTEGPGSQRDLARVAGAEIHTALGRLAEAVRHGRPAFDLAFGVGFYEHLADHPRSNAIWNRSMIETAGPYFVDSGLLDVAGWVGDEVVIDVGGGAGTLLADLLSTHPAMSGVLFDLAPAVETAPSLLDRAGVADRCRIVVGSFFLDQLPQGGDVYLLARVVFNWGDDDARTLLRAVHSAMAPTARLVLLDSVRPEAGRVTAGQLNDLSTLLIGGRIRSRPEWEGLLASAGFDIPTFSVAGSGLLAVVSCRPRPAGGGGR